MRYGCRRAARLMGNEPLRWVEEDSSDTLQLGQCPVLEHQHTQPFLPIPFPPPQPPQPSALATLCFLGEVYQHYQRARHQAWITHSERCFLCSSSHVRKSINYLPRQLDKKWSCFEQKMEPSGLLFFFVLLWQWLAHTTTYIRTCVLWHPLPHTAPAGSYRRKRNHNHSQGPEEERLAFKKLV